MSVKASRVRLIRLFPNLIGEVNMNYIANNPEYRSMTVHPMLLAFMQDVFAKAPNIQFEAWGKTEKFGQDSTIVRTMTEVRVWDADEVVGNVDVTGRNHPSKGFMYEYGVTSRLVRKEKGKRDTKMTANRKVAVKTALKVFKRKPADELAKQYWNEAENIVLRSKTATSRSLNDTTNDKLMAYHYVLEAHRQGTPVPLNDKLRTMIEKLATQLDSLRVATSLWDKFVATRGIVIAVGRTGVLNVVDLKDLSKVTTVQSIYDMPINYQEKFGLLHIVDEEQAVENVGIKWTRAQDECKSYFLVDGDTVAY